MTEVEEIDLQPHAVGTVGCIQTRRGSHVRTGTDYKIQDTDEGFNQALIFRSQMGSSGARNWNK